jgi:hypothetical protein
MVAALHSGQQTALASPIGRPRDGQGTATRVVGELGDRGEPVTGNVLAALVPIEAQGEAVEHVTLGRRRPVGMVAYERHPFERANCIRSGHGDRLGGPGSTASSASASAWPGA